MDGEQTATRMPEIGDRFAGDYEILEQVGVGGYARVYRSRAHHLDAEVAVKVLDPHLGGSALDAFLRRFYREALLTSALTHPNTVTPIDYGRNQDGTAYIVMEYLDGESIADLLDRGDQMPVHRVRRIMIDVLESLHEAHARGIVHADIKSSNIFLQRGNPHARVLDFGVASLIDDESNAQQVFGTPHYIAPEAAVGNPVSPASDIYSLGITAYEMLHQRFPFDAANPREILKAHVVSPMPEIRADVRNTALGHFIERSTAKSPAIRPNALECIEILRSSTSPIEPLLGGPLTPAQGIHVRLHTGETEGPRFAATPSLRLRTIKDDVSVIDAAVHGRTEAARRLRSLVTAHLKGPGGVVVVSGPGGVGKERVIRSVLEDRTVQLQDEQIFYMLGDICTTPDGRVDIASLLEQIPRRFDGFERLLEPAAELARAIRQRPGDQALLQRFCDLIITVARKRPFAWVLTSLERADDQVALLLGQLLNTLKRTPAPVCVLLAFSNNEPVSSRNTSYLLRNLEASAWNNGFVVPISRLSDAQMEELARSLEPMADNVVSLLVELAEGNPGRMLWLLRNARERKLLRIEHGRLVRRLRADFAPLREDVDRPAEVRDRLADVLREEEVLQPAIALSFLGKRFPETLGRELLRQLADLVGSELDSRLDAAIDRNILTRTVVDGQVWFTFQQHAALQSLQTLIDQDELDVITLAAAMVLERDRESHESQLRAARLFSRSGDPHVAARCALNGARVARAAGNFEAESELYTLAMSECEQADMRFPLPFIAEVEIGLARCRMNAGAIGAAEELLLRANERATGARLDRHELESHLLLAEIGLQRGDSEAIGSRARRMMQLARESSDPSDLARALLLVGQFSRAAGKKKDAAKLLVQAEKIAGEHQIRDLQARARMGIARLLAEEQKYTRAEQLMQEALNYFRASERFDQLIEALVELGNLRLLSGRPSDALFRDAERLAEEQGYGRMFADILSGQARAMYHLGELNTATILFLRAVERYRALNNRRGEASTLLWLSRTSLERKQVEAARTYAVEAVDAHRDARDASGYIDSLLLAADVALMRRNLPDAQRFAHEARERLIGNRRRVGDMVNAILTEARALHLNKRSAEALGLVNQAMSIATEERLEDLKVRCREVFTEVNSGR